jgi:hypothetical protein
MQRIFQEIKNTATTVSIYIQHIYRQHFKINYDIHNINTRNYLDLHYPQFYLSVYQKGAHYTGIKVFNRLPVPIKQLSHDTKQFKMALKSFLYLHSFYSLNEYFKYNAYYILRLFI